MENKLQLAGVLWMGSQATINQVTPIILDLKSLQMVTPLNINSPLKVPFSPGIGLGLDLIRSAEELRYRAISI